ncbi:hypothetical protein MXB_2591, partial [Myxobolus squamalis]
MWRDTDMALTDGKFIWPSYLNILLSFFDIIYTPFPSISCLPNIFTGKNLGWYGNNIFIFFLPIILALIISIIVSVVYKIKKIILIQPIYSYLMLMSVLQFPLGSLSLSTLACTYDKITNKYYMVSEPWLECHLNSPIQICGVVGVLLYLFGIPITLHYWYWNSSFLKSVKKEIGELILPAGSKEDSIFLTFVTTRSIILAMIVSVIPSQWNISNLIIFLILGSNIIIVLNRKPYKQSQVSECKLNEAKQNCSDFIISGELLEVSSIFMILTS